MKNSTMKIVIFLFASGLACALGSPAVVIAQMPQQSIVIGSKGFELNYAFAEENEEQISKLLEENNFDFYYKDFDDQWINQLGYTVDKSMLPEVEYKYGDGTACIYEKEDGRGRDLRQIEVNPDIFQEDFESGDFLKWDAAENANGQKADIVLDINDPSNKVFRSYTWEGYNALLRPRAELRVDNNEEIGKDYWYSWKFMIGSECSHNSASEIIAQLHSKPDFDGGEDWDNWIDGSFSMAIMLKPFTDKLYFSATYMDIIELDTGITLEKGEWNDVVLHVRHSVGDDGYIEGWINGKSMFYFDGTDCKISGQTAYNNQGNYFKIGSYRYNYTSWTNPVELAAGESCIYYDDVKIGTKMEEVK